MSAAVDPAKRGRKRVRIEQEMLDSRPGARRACQLIRGLMGLIATSFLGTRGTRCSPRVAPPFPSRLGTTQVSRGLALVGTNYLIIYLGFDTTLVSSGASPVTLTPGGGGINLLIVRATGKHFFGYSIYLFY